MNETLSICIPTFNRSKLLRQCLDCFVAQTAKYSIPIYVSDNASTDDTREMLRSYQAQHYPHLFFQSNATNLGIDGNMARVVEMARTRFCWLFGDDDAIAEGAVDAVLAALKGEVDLVIVNASVRTFDLGEVVDERRIGLRTDRVYEPSECNQLLRDTVHHATYLGSLVVNREKWLGIKEVPYATDFYHVAVAFTYAAHCRSAVIAKPYIQCRLTQSSWSHRKFEVLMVNWPHAVWSLNSDYDDAAKAAVTPRSRLTSIKHLMAARAMGFYDLEAYRKIVAARLSRGWVKGLARLAAGVPSWICRLLFKAYLRISRVAGYRLFLHEMNSSKQMRAGR